MRRKSDRLERIKFNSENTFESIGSGSRLRGVSRCSIKRRTGVVLVENQKSFFDGLAAGQEAPTGRNEIRFTFSGRTSRPACIRTKQ